MWILAVDVCLRFTISGVVCGLSFGRTRGSWFYLRLAEANIASIASMAFRFPTLCSNAGVPLLYHCSTQSCADTILASGINPGRTMGPDSGEMFIWFVGVDPQLVLRETETIRECALN